MCARYRSKDAPHVKACSHIVLLLVKQHVKKCKVNEMKNILANMERHPPPYKVEKHTFFGKQLAKNVFTVYIISFFLVNDNS